MPVTDEEFDELLHCGFEREALHLEMRDAYGTAVELPHMAKWTAGEADDLLRVEVADVPGQRAVAGGEQHRRPVVVQMGNEAAGGVQADHARVRRRQAGRDREPSGYGRLHARRCSCRPAPSWETAHRP